MTKPRLLGSRYELDCIVGRGGMAEVFRARDIRLAAGLPFAFDAATFVVGAALIASIRRGRTALPAPERTRLRREITQGIRWLLAHPGLRVLAAAICVMNIMLGSTLAILVLYVRVRLGLGAAGYGAPLACSAAGGAIGTVIVKRLLGRFSASLLLRVGLIIECATHLSFALTRRPWVAALTLVVFGVHNGIGSGACFGGAVPHRGNTV